VLLHINRFAAKKFRRSLDAGRGSFRLQERAMTGHRDQDEGKGAVEDEGPKQPGNSSLGGQLGHRDQDPMIKSSDSDFPEPGGNPEHSGEKSAARKK
jgi:hypothetical protein